MVATARRRARERRLGHALYRSVAKACTVMLTQVSALALAEHNIRVNCVVPGPVLRPAGEPEEVLEHMARACTFLATNDFATGTVMRVDGGEGLARGET